MSTIETTSTPSLSLIAYAPPVAPDRRVYDTLAERMRSAAKSVRRHEQRRGYVLAAVAGHLGTDPDGLWGAEVITSALTDQGDGSVTLGLEHLLLGESAPSSRRRLTYLLLRAEAGLIGQRPGAGYECTARTLALAGVIPQARAASGSAWDAAITAAIADECAQPAAIAAEDWTLLVAYLDAARAYVSGTCGADDARALAMTCLGVAHMLRAAIESGDPADADIAGICSQVVRTMDWCSRVHLLLSPGGIPGELWERGATRWIRCLSDAMDGRWRSQAHPIPSPIVVAGMLARGDFDRAVEHVDVDDPELPYRWIRSSDLRDDDTAERVYCFPQVSAEQRSALLECGWIEATAEMIQHSLDVRAAASAAEQLERQERQRIAAIEAECAAAKRRIEEAALDLVIEGHPMMALGRRIAAAAASIATPWYHHRRRFNGCLLDKYHYAASVWCPSVCIDIERWMRGDQRFALESIDRAILQLRGGVGAYIDPSALEGSEAEQHAAFAEAVEGLISLIIELRAQLEQWFEAHPQPDRW